MTTENHSDEPISFESNQISSDEQLSQIIDSINLTTTTAETAETTEATSTTTTSATNEEESQTKEATPRTAAQTEIGAKLVKKLETLANSKENKQTNGKNGSATATASNNNESESRRNINKVASKVTFSQHRNTIAFFNF